MNEEKVCKKGIKKKNPVSQMNKTRHKTREEINVGNFKYSCSQHL